MRPRAAAPLFPIVCVPHHRQKQKKTKKSELRSCVKDEVAVLGSPLIISLMVAVNVKHHERRREEEEEEEGMF